MLKYLELEHVGPAPSMRLDFAPRLTLLTGDNGLGKTFVLDIAWWALAHTWVEEPAWPSRPSAGTARIGVEVEEWPDVSLPLTSSYDYASQSWPLPDHNLPAHALVVYARVDGGFSVWDPVRCMRRWMESNAPGEPRDPPGDHFTNHRLLEGLETNGRVVCNGLIRDWCTWQDRQNEQFATLAEVVAGLSPNPENPIRPGRPRRLSIADAREIPTVELPYGTVPVTLASAGMQRILSLAYLMVWACYEHKAAAELSKQQGACRLVLLLDEVESHLHPQWQRTLLPALMTVARRLAQSPELEADVQVIASTHAPLVLASMESEFDEEKDRILTFEMHDGRVTVREVPWAKQGDAVNWLVSDAFGLRQARSREAEQAIEAAEAFMRGDRAALPGALTTQEQIDNRLREVLPGHDPFWPRWVVHAEKAET